MIINDLIAQHEVDLQSEEFKDSPFVLGFKNLNPPDNPNRFDPTIITSAVEAVKYHTSKDRKIPVLKNLQGEVWKSCYASGKVVAPLYDDVAPAIKNWVEEDGIKVRTCIS
jgi:hypothetical protein